MFYPYSDDPRLWDPSTGSIVAAAPVGYNIFCSGLTLLADGRCSWAGGHISNNVGLNDASIYDPQANTWARQPDMNAGRWYPTTTTLADGSVLVVSGDIDTTVGVNRLPQVWTNGAWRDLTTAQIAAATLPLHAAGARRQGLQCGTAADLALPRHERHRRVDERPGEHGWKSKLWQRRHV